MFPLPAAKLLKQQALTLRVVMFPLPAAKRLKQQYRERGILYPSLTFSRFGLG
jgi:hypothetical protein